MKHLLTIMLVMLACLTYAAGQRRPAQYRTDGFAQGVRGTAKVHIPTASSNLVAWYTFSSGDGTLQLDSSGNNYSATNAYGGYIPTVANGYMTITGASYGMKTKDVSILNSATEWTLTGWVKRDNQAINLFPSILAKWGGGNRSGYLIAAGTSSLLYVFINGTGGDGQVPTSNTILTNADWTFTAGSYKQNTASTGYCVLLNSTFAFGTSPNIATLSSGAWWLGVFNGPAALGSLDDLRIYNRQLTTNEILSVKAEGRQ